MRDCKYIDEILDKKVPRVQPLIYGDGCLTESVVFSGESAKTYELSAQLAMFGIYIAVADDWVSELSMHLKNMRVLEVGAGRCLLSSALSQNGVYVISSDPFEAPLFDVPHFEPCDAEEAILRFAERVDVLLLSAPNGKWATSAIKAWASAGKELVLYIGEGSGGADAPYSFFNLLSGGDSWGGYVALKMPYGRRDSVEFYKILR